MNGEIAAGIKKYSPYLALSIVLIVVGALEIINPKEEADQKLRNDDALPGEELDSDTSSATGAIGSFMVPFKSGEKRITQAEVSVMRQEEILYSPDSDNAQKEAALFRLGNLNYLHVHDYDQATTFYQELINDYPESKNLERAYIRMADAYHRAQNYDEEIRVYQAMMDFYPEDSAEFEWAKDSEKRLAEE